MITASAAFLALEAAAQGGLAEPVYLATFAPWLLPAGVSGGTFTDSHLVAPAKIEVDADAVTASWESADLSTDFEFYPQTYTASWTQDLTGYALTSAQYKTAETQAGLAGASYQAMTSGSDIDLQRWYKLKFSFTGKKCLFTDTGTEFPERQMKFADAPGGNKGFFVDGTGNASSVDGLELKGDWPINTGLPEEIGAITLEEPRDFTDLVSGEHTLKLMDPDNLYNPHHADFIYAAESWKNLTMKVLFGYRKLGTRNVEFLTDPIFEGKVIDWNRIEPGENGVPRAEIYARDWIAELLKTPLGKPDSDGNPQPVITGTVMAEAKQVFDTYTAPPEKDIDFETGDFSQISGIEAIGGGAVTIVSGSPLYGTYSARTATSGANQTARMRIKPLVPSTGLTARGWFKIINMPDPPGDRLTKLMSLYDTFKVYVDAAAKVWVLYDSIWHETDCYLSAYQGFRVKFSIALLAANPGLFRLRIGGEEIFSEQADFSGFTTDPQGFYLGPVTDGTGETWQIDWDHIEFWPGFAPLLYQVPGYPFQAMEAIYQDCVKVEKREAKTVTETTYQPLLPIGGAFSIKQSTKVTPANYSTNLTYGTIEFNYADWYSVPPRGTVMARVRKNTITHPVDVAEYIITLRGLAARINAASFAAAKAAIPNYSVGCTFENTKYGDALRALCQSCLLILAMDRGQFFLRAYTGSAPAGPVLDLTALIKNSEDENFPFSNDGAIPKVTAIWGMSEQNPDLYHEETDSDLTAEELADNPDQIDLDFSWGQPVASENSDMCIAITQALLKRVKGRRNSPETIAFLNSLRLELGDVVSRNTINYRVGRKELDGGTGIILTLERYEGES